MPLSLTAQIHESIHTLQRMAGLANLLLASELTFWRVNLRPQAPGEEAFTQMFPNGGTILFLDSMILDKPKETVDSFRWFRKSYLPNRPPNSWKLAMRPCVKSWCVEVYKAKSKVSKETAKPYADLFEQCNALAPLHMMNHEDEFETPLEDAPYASASHILGYDIDVGTLDDGSALRRNDDLLVRWYGDWTLRRATKHRKFLVVSDSSDDAKAQWRRECRHLTIESMERFFDRFRISLWLKHEASKEEATKKSRVAEKSSGPPKK